jgi:TolB-like protein
MTPDIFLSYTREDQATAQRFAEAFEAQGFKVWWDVTLRSGEAYDQVTEEALRTAKAVVVLWSKKSVTSRWVRAEATIAERQKTLMPVTIEPCERPVMFELTQTSELSDWRGQVDDKAWLAFLDDLRRKVGPDAVEPTRAAQAPAPAAVGAGNGPPFVAVLPFAHRDDDKLEILAADLTEDVTRELAQNSYFRVIGAATTAAWRGKPADYRTLRREMDAAYLIEGKLQKSGDEVRLTVQLVDAATGGMLKSARFAHKLADIAASPEEFSAAVGVRLGEQIEQIEMIRAMNKPGPLSGWDHLLRAMAYERRAGSDSTRRSIEEARRAVAAEPELGLAHAMLAKALATPAGGLGEVLADDVRREIQTHGRRAMQLDGDNPAVIVSLIPGAAFNGDSEGALRLAQRAAELSPYSPVTIFWLAATYAGVGRTADAIAVFPAYERLSRSDRYRATALWIFGMSYFLEDQPAEAEAELDRSLALNPEFIVALKWKAIVAAHRGDDETAIASVKRMREIEPEVSIDQHVWQMVRVPKLGERCAAAVAILRRLWDATEGGA